MMKVRGFITHKKAETYEDCQDYFAINKDKGRLAISDGMSQSIFPQWWAEELVRAYVYDDWVPDQNDLDKLRENWLKWVHEFLESQKQSGKPTWMLENCLIEKRGAGATFCGVRLKNESEWEGYILGDSCLMNVDKNNRIVKIERTGEEIFNNNPDYFDSLIGGKGIVKIIHGTAEEGTKLLLVTDALAEFLHSKIGRESDYVHRLLQIENHNAFCSLIDEWRASEDLHNDDTTLVIIEYDGSECLEVSFKDDLVDLCNTDKNTEKVDGETNVADGVFSKKKRPAIRWIEEAMKSAEKIKNFSVNLYNRLIDQLQQMMEQITNPKRNG